MQIENEKTIIAIYVRRRAGRYVAEKNCYGPSSSLLHDSMQATKP